MSTKMVSVRFDTELLEYLQKRADEQHRTLSSMICSILLDDKVIHDRPKVKKGDTIQSRNGVAIIKSIDKEYETWQIEWQSGMFDKGHLDCVPDLLQHNWKKVLS